MFGNDAVADIAAPSVARPRLAIAGWSAPALLVAAFAIGSLLRLGPVLLADFPLNDGGMFFAMIRDLQQAHYQLPLFTSYNQAGIPFAYPPLPFYLAAILDDLTPLNLFDVLRFVPALATVLSLGAMYRLARSFHGAEASVAASVVTFALLPESFVWPIMGGGLTRAVGMLFALLAMAEAHRLYARDEPRAVPWLILWSSLTALSHIEWAWFLALACGAMCIANCRSRRALFLSAVVAVTTLAFTVPWWGSVLLHHGWAPFAAALLTGYGATADAAAGEIAIGHFVALAGVLLLLALRRRRLFYFGWIGLIIMLNMRSLFRLAALPISLANGELFAPPEAISSTESASGSRAGITRRLLQLGFSVSLAFVLWLEVIGPLAITRGLGHLTALPSEERTAMEWISQNTPDSTQFLVVSGVGWAIDRSAEWFPVLADRRSVLTVQGTEWLPRGAFTAADKAQEELNHCVHQNVDCLTSWAEEFGVGYSHIYVAGDCCTDLRASLSRDSSFQVIYENAGASIFARAPLP